MEPPTEEIRMIAMGYPGLYCTVGSGHEAGFMENYFGGGDMTIASPYGRIYTGFDVVDKIDGITSHIFVFTPLHGYLALRRPQEVNEEQYISEMRKAEGALFSADLKEEQKAMDYLSELIEYFCKARGVKVPDVPVIALVHTYGGPLHDQTFDWATAAKLLQERWKDKVEFRNCGVDLMNYRKNSRNREVWHSLVRNIRQHKTILKEKEKKSSGCSVS